jgi:pSer/pThr/pTyr-binding forkhead associated (FHA) protein
MLAGSTLLGRKPSLEVSNAVLDAHRGEHIDVVTLVDSTRTVSRNHAFVTFGEDGIVRIQDLGSLNGTFIISDGDESSVVEGTAAVIDAGMTLRVGDEFYEIERVPQN